MRRRILGLTLSGILAPSLSYALGLGEISTYSGLNQPLSAEIELVSTAPGEVDQVTVKLAPESVFNQVGITRSRVLDQLLFTPTVVNGTPVIRVTSQSPIQEPFINFVVEVAWAKGKLLREYTVLLDPPTMARDGGGAPIGTAPVVAPPSDGGLPPFVASQPSAQPLPAETLPADDVGSIAAVEPEPYPPVTSSPYQGAAVPGEGLPPFVDGSARPAAPVADAPLAETFEPPVGETYTEEGALAQERAVESLPEAETFSEPPPAGQPTITAMPPGSAFDPETGTSQIFVSPPDASRSFVSDSDDLGQDIFTDDSSIASAPPARSSDGGTYKVRRGDTLNAIARRNVSGRDVSVNQMMIGILRENPGAFFKENINALKSGYILRIPESSALSGISEAEARQEVIRQVGLWKQYRSQLASSAVRQQSLDTVDEKTQEKVAGDVAPGTPDSGLKIMVPDEEGQSAEGGEGAAKAVSKELALAKEQLESATRENEELKSRVSELEALLEAKDRLIQLKEDRLADLQQQVGDAKMAITPQDTSDAEAPEADPDGDASEMVAEVTPLGEDGLSPAPEEVDSIEEELLANVEEAEEIETAQEQPPILEPIEEEVAEEQAQSQPETSTTPQALAEQPEEASPSLVDDLKSNPNLLMGAGVGGVLLLTLAWLMLRRREKPVPEEEVDMQDLGDVETVFADNISDKTGGVTGEITMGGDYDTGSVEYEDVPEGDIENVDDEDTPTIQINNEVEGESEKVASFTDQDDSTEDEVLSEANVYLAYGLHDQAIELLQPAVVANPDNKDYQLKLLEAYYGTKNKEGFVNTATKLNEMVKGSDQDAWQRVVALGKNLVPGHALFADEETPDVSVSQLVERPEDMSTSLGSFDDETTGGLDVKLNLDADDIKTGDIKTNDTLSGGDISFGDDTSAVEGEHSIGLSASNEFELEKDPAGELQLPNLDELSKSLQLEEDDAIASLRKSVEEFDKEGSDGSETVGLSDFNFPDLEERASESGKDDPSEMTLTGGGDLGIDLSELTRDSGDKTIQLSNFEDDSEYNIGDVEQEFTRLTTGADEVKTKLDLAKAYLDMGDDEGAREALQEVIAQGDDEQRSEAEKLMGQIN